MVHRFLLRHQDGMQVLLDRLWGLATEQSEQTERPSNEISWRKFEHWHELVSRYMYSAFDEELSRTAASFEWSLASAEQHASRQIGNARLQRELFVEWMYDVLEAWSSEQQVRSAA